MKFKLDSRTPTAEQKGICGFLFSNLQCPKHGESKQNECSELGFIGPRYWNEKAA